MELYRYISFETFVDIVLSKELTFVNPITSWDDGYEGMVFRALQTNEGSRKIKEMVDAVPGKHLFVPQMVDPIRGQCWSTKRDSIALWSMYSYDNKAIMIRTTGEKIKNLTNGINNVTLCKIDYYEADKENSFEEECKKAIDKAIQGDTINILEFFKIKRDYFEHENEVRAMSVVPIGDSFSSRINKPLRIKIDKPINEFIDEVMVHPNAEEWYVPIVEKVCSIDEKNKINFSGKSKILQFFEK